MSDRGNKRKGNKGGQNQGRKNASSNNRPPQASSSNSGSGNNQKRSQDTSKSSQSAKPKLLPLRLTEELFSNFKDPISVLERWLKEESSSLLLKELSDGDTRGKNHLDSFERYCNWETKNQNERRKLASLLLQLLSRESFLESTQEESVANILETALPTQLFRTSNDQRWPPLGFELLALSQSQEYGKNLAIVLSKFIDLFPRLAIVQLQQLIMGLAQVKCVEPVRKVVDRHQTMFKMFSQTGEIPKPTEEVIEKKPILQRPPARYEMRDDPVRGENAISASALPTEEEMITLRNPLRVRTNPIVNNEGSESIGDYLDTQWRLLRSDGLSDIREGLALVKEAKLKHATAIFSLKPGAPRPVFQYPRSTSYRVYTDVKMISFGDSKAAGPNRLAYLASFNVPGKTVNWAVSRRLIPGSLLCLSSDHFETSIWATVAARDEKLLAEHKISILVAPQFLHLVDAGSTYEMLESTALWTSYEPVLDQLYNFYKRRTNGNFPKPALIVGQNWLDNDHVFRGTWHLKSITKNGAASAELEVYLKYSDEEIIRRRKAERNRGFLMGLMNLIAPQDDRIYAYPDHLTILDESQWHAMKMILTKGVSLVQGPPGTGKTFIGLKATEILLKQNGFDGPILCVCYTNHALDQFLEGIMSFERKIVRIGGRCKSEKLLPFTLHALQPRHEMPYVVRRDVRERNEIREELQKHMTQLNNPWLFIEEFFSFCGLRLDVSLSERLDWLFAFLGFPLPEKNTAPTNATASSSNQVDVPELPLEEENDSDTDSAYDESEASEGELDELLQRDYADEAEEDELTEEEFLEAMAARNQHQKPGKKDGNRGKNGGNGGAAAPKSNSSGNSMEKILEKYGTCSALATLCRQADARISDRYRGGASLRPDRLSAYGLHHRRTLFVTWLHFKTKELHELVKDLIEDFTALSASVKAFDDDQTAHFLRQQKVIGMTTTGAAKNATILQSLRPRVVIVEEAAEIFEAHVIACLTSSVEKLILIGDHQQLRPKVVHYPLTKRGLDISLFERLIIAGMPHVTLRQQHRMHPDISRYLKPIYPQLFDGPRTRDDRLEYDYFGLDKRVHFMTHNWKEAGGGKDDEAASKSNAQEAEYIYGLVRFLISQGLEPSKVTIIAMYQGQNQLLRRHFRNNPPKGFPDIILLRNQLKEVHICCVDDYQGEENEVIIVSLVRSNDQGVAGFVRIANRVCVALSRARSMMFVLGSSDTLKADAKRAPRSGRSEEPIWPSILELMQQHGTVTRDIRLTCPIHTEGEISEKRISNPQDWKQALSYCDKLCSTQLDCGHWCQQKCHGRTPHQKCTQECQKIFSDCKHKCPKLCYEDCGQCLTLVPKILRCGHHIKVPCSQYDKPDWKCTTLCPLKLSCGHPCVKLCGQRCGDCYVNIESVKSPCGHILQNLPCHIASNRSKLVHHPHPCNHKLSCNHSCNGNCYTCKSTNQHKTCTGKCGRSLPCTHACRGNCAEPCPPCLLKCPKTCAHGPCKHECGKRCTPCMDKCRWKCKHKTCTQVCSDMCDRVGCEEACPEILKCGHPCVGLCGEICPKNCRVCEPGTLVFSANFFQEPLNCDQDSRYIFLVGCGHLIEFGAMDHWMKSRKDDGIISLPTCPMCKSPISHTYGRYSNDVKEQLAFLDQVRARYRKDAIRAKFKEGVWKAVENMIKSLFNVKPLGHSMEPPPRDIDMLLLLAAAKMKLGRDEGDVSVLVDEVLRREPNNAEAKEIEGSLLSKVIPTLARALANEVRHGGWYTCANGHPYVIGECGGAMQEAKCPCGARIGGRNHALRGDNRHYGAADGSRHAAWGDAANMANYQLDG